DHYLSAACHLAAGDEPLGGAMASFRFTVDGRRVSVNAEPEMPLLYALRNDLGLDNPHFGCGLAQCGACTVHLDGEAVRSCVLPVTGAVAQAAAGKPALVPTELDSWVAVLPDGRVQAFFGKMDMGQSLEVAIAQIVADELDVACDKVDVLMGDTGTSCNQGGA